MSEKEDQIRYRLKILSQIEPSPEAAQRAVQTVRDTLVKTKQQRESIGSKIIRMVSNGHTLKFAAAAILLIAVGFIAGRSFVVEQDIEALRASIVPAVTQSVIERINEQWQKEYARNYTQIKDDLSRQMSQEMTELTEQTLAASDRITEQRMKELIQLIEAARVKDRQWIAAAIEQIELNRRQDNARIGSLVSFATQTNQLK
jgi:virulence-associated protein VapD